MKRHPSDYAARSSDGRFVRRKRRAAPRYPPSARLIADWRDFYRPIEAKLNDHTDQAEDRNVGAANRRR